jgi:hypothetical protein
MMAQAQLDGHTGQQPKSVPAHSPLQQAVAAVASVQGAPVPPHGTAVVVVVVVVVGSTMVPP